MYEKKENFWEEVKRVVKKINSYRNGWKRKEWKRCKNF